MIKTAPMKPNTKIGIVALASSMETQKILEGEKFLRRLGFDVLIAPSCFESSHRYLAGLDDESRALDLKMMFADDEIGLILNMRGGYGSNRIIPYLGDFDFSKYPKPFIGYSDITYLHIYLNQFHRLITYHGPMIKDLLTEDKMTIDSFFNGVVNGKAFTLKQVSFLTPYESIVSGRLVGGNLSIVASTLGTPYEIETAGKILFLEEVGEPSYSVDRLLYHLIYAGKIESCAGIILGDFSGEEKKGNYQTLLEILSTFDKPIAWKIKAGHCIPNLSLPLGTVCRMDCENNRITFTDF